MTDLATLKIAELGPRLAHLFLNLLHHVVWVRLGFNSEFRVGAICSKAVYLFSMQCQIRTLLKLLTTIAYFTDVRMNLGVRIQVLS